MMMGVGRWRSLRQVGRWIPSAIIADQPLPYQDILSDGDVLHKPFDQYVGKPHSKGWVAGLDLLRGDKRTRSGELSRSA